MAIYTCFEYWCSTLQHRDQYLYNLSQQLPFYLICKINGKIPWKAQFLTIYAILQHLGSISEYRRTSLVRTQLDRKPRSIVFFWKSRHSVLCFLTWTTSARSNTAISKLPLDRSIFLVPWLLQQLPRSNFLLFYTKIQWLSRTDIAV